MNNWKDIWNNRKREEISIDNDNPENVFMELKHKMGISQIDKKDEIVYKDFYNQFMEYYYNLINNLDEKEKPWSFYDVGCGTGGYLYLLNQIDSDYSLGGIDFSEPFVNITKQVLPNLREISCGDASSINTDIMYDCVYSRSIFQYFPDLSYAETVVRKMINKARYSIGIFDVHDISKREAFIKYRRNSIKDYEKNYDDNSHLFFEKSFFMKIAKEYNCEINFSKAKLPNYWNDEFTYDVYLYKKNY